MEESLLKLIGDPIICKEIILQRKRFGKLSTSFLIRKFKFNEYFAKKIVEITEKQKGAKNGQANFESKKRYHKTQNGQS